ncbi:helicase-related protein [Clostridium hydrogeniformans]|uniref:helicase-related protein n=1 Tax=Clostridium hydrogeniformans TaxID=349933 RepID=UPI000486A2F8|nr:DEAD/DEAH box helicase [Clostridium hydrogeniformans]
MKIQGAEREFKKIKEQLATIKNIIFNSKDKANFQNEKFLRDKITLLKEVKLAIRKSKNEKKVREVDKIIQEYEELLEYISEKIVENYNRQNKTEFNFQELKSTYYEGYLYSGILNVLITRHIPKLINKSLDIMFKENPKEEYEKTREIKRKIYLHLGDTNTGKTYNAMESLKKCKNGIYLSPLRILALENFEKLNNEGIICSLLTGEEEIKREGATHISSTIETLNLSREYEVAVIDEIQLIGDKKRGYAWTRALLGLQCKEIHICGAINTKDLLINIIEDIGDEYILKEYKRDIPLILENKGFSERQVNQGDALVMFSKKKVLEMATFYSNNGVKTSLIYGDLPPEVRRLQYEEFLKGKSKILITTDAIGMGVNLPIKRIVFIDIKKFDGEEIRYLTSQEIKQIAGRSGRKGIYDKGYVSSYTNYYDHISEALNREDTKINCAILGPSEDILKIKGASLREKLSIWSERPIDIKFYRKMDISKYLIILDAIKRYKLEESIQWKLLKVPFDEENENLMECFLFYIDELFILNKDEIEKPRLKYNTLHELEEYYQKINIYYSFGKLFKIKFNEKWVYEERIKISESINRFLINI